MTSTSKQLNLVFILFLFSSCSTHSMIIHNYFIEPYYIEGKYSINPARTFEYSIYKTLLKNPLNKPIHYLAFPWTEFFLMRNWH